MDLTITNFRAQPAFGHVPLLLSAVSHIRASAEAAKASAAAAAESLPSIVADPDAPAPAAPPTTFRLTADVESAAAVLVDDRYGHNIEVLSARLQVCCCLCRFVNDAQFI